MCPMRWLIRLLLGHKVTQIHEGVQLLGIEAGITETKGRKNPFKAILDVLSECMNPILEPMMAAEASSQGCSIVSLTGLIS